MRIRPTLVVATVLAVALVLLGSWMVIAGWPARTPTERTLLDLAQLPMAGAVVVGIAEMTLSRRLWQRSRRTFLGIFAPAAVVLLIGVVLLGVAYGVGAPGLVGTGMLLVWLAVGLAFVYVAIDSLRRETGTERRLLLTEVTDDDLDGDDHLDEWGDEEWTDDDADGFAPQADQGETDGGR